MRRAPATVALLSALVLLAACGEKPQTNAHGVRIDAARSPGCQPPAVKAVPVSGLAPVPVHGAASIRTP